MTTLVLLPGLDGTGVLFSNFLKSLGPQVKTRVASYPVDSPQGYVDLQSVAASFIPSDEPYVLFAESFSGPIAILIASTRPKFLKGLILCCSFARTPSRFAVRLFSLFGSAPIKILPNGILGKILLGRSSNAKVRNALTEALSRISGGALKGRIKSVASVDVSANLREIRVPILYLRATKDSLVPKSAFRLISEFAPHAKLVEIEGPHLLVQAAPSATAAITRDFLERVS
jgi:pimeloyl-ACP methyl ester carboxylesterase